jgi:hypothetical protein
MIHSITSFEKNQLLELVFEYEFTVREAVKLLNNKSKYDKGFQVKRVGYLDALEEYRYVFHGFGCLVITKEFEVNFEFGEDGRCDGIKPEFLWHFLLKNKSIKLNYPMFNSSDQLKDILEELENDGVFVKDLEGLTGKPMVLYNDTLFYLASSINSSTVPFWNAHVPD